METKKSKCIFCEGTQSDNPLRNVSNDSKLWQEHQYHQQKTSTPISSKKEEKCDVHTGSYTGNIANGDVIYICSECLKKPFPTPKPVDKEEVGEREPIEEWYEDMSAVDTPLEVKEGSKDIEWEIKYTCDCGHCEERRSIVNQILSQQEAKIKRELVDGIERVELKVYDKTIDKRVQKYTREVIEETKQAIKKLLSY